ncbi:MFS transporter [Azoarcus sp. TTM-91]|uniref:MFS transporter n=1 Tax=Azoarcus sp. TTM-91 TaxID=2691581 RepID=UPI00145F823A|nr:MFS transporter [Azoarcus sp. TTM-91]
MSSTPPLSWRPFLWVASALCVGTMSTALASPLYPLYQAAWQLSASMITIIYVAYMGGVLAAFLFLGRLPDHIGPVKVLRTAMAGIFIGIALSAVAPDAGWLLAGRIVIGVASGLITTSATAGLVELEPAGQPRRATLVASTVSILGFGLGPLVAGVLAQFAPHPLVTPYLLVIVLVALVLHALLKMETRPRAGGRLSLQPRFMLPAVAARPRFALAAMGAFSAFALFSLYASLSPSFIAGLLPWHGSAVSGAAIALILFCSASAQLLGRRLSAPASMRGGLALLAVSVVLLAAALHYRSGALFISSDLIGGLGHGLAFMAALNIANASAGGGERSGILASFFTVGYIGTIVPILGVGFLADRVGLDVAVVCFCAAFGLLMAAMLWQTRRLLPLRTA